MSDDELVQRPLGALDLDRAARLHREAFVPMGERGWTRQDIAGLLASPGTNGFLLEAKSGDIGMAICRVAADEAELLDRLSKPSGLSDEEVMEKASIIISRAVENGMMSVQVFRFPHTLCTDNGRAINQGEAGWEQTLTGIPNEIFAFWKRQLQSRGYHIRYEIIDYPNGMPGDVGIFLSWG